MRIALFSFWLLHTPTQCRGQGKMVFNFLEIFHVLLRDSEIITNNQDFHSLLFFFYRLANDEFVESHRTPRIRTTRREIFHSRKLLEDYYLTDHFGRIRLVSRTKDRKRAVAPDVRRIIRHFVQFQRKNKQTLKYTSRRRFQRNETRDSESKKFP